MIRLNFLAVPLMVALCLVGTCREVEAGGPSGRWKGSWNSGATGHSGALRARIRQVDQNTFRALFAGRFAKVIPFVYPAKLTRVPGSYNQFQSSQRLPVLGTYTMHATISPSRFYATFRGKKDTGVFQMNRR